MNTFLTNRGVMVVRRFLIFGSIMAGVVFAQIPEYKITMSPTDYELLFTRDIFSDSLLPAVFEYQGSSWIDARIRFKGRSTRYFPKKSYRVRFTILNQFQNARQINFNSMYSDKSFIREKLAWDLFADMNMLAPSAHHARVTINNEWKGLYLFVDKIDRYFLQRRGRIIAPMYNADDLYTMGDLTVQPDSLLYLYYPKEVGNPLDYSDLRSLIETINSVPDSSFADVVNNLFDVNSVIDWLAGNTLMMMGDTYNKNYYLYRDTTLSSQQWVIIPWDYDISFGRNGDLSVPYPASLLNDGFVYTFRPLSGPSNVLKDRIKNTPVLRERLRQRVDTLLQIVFTEQRMYARIDSLAELVRDHVALDPQKWGTYQDFLDHVEALKYFVTARRDYLLKTFINPPSGQYDLVTLPITKLSIPYHFVAFDGRQIATMWFTSIQGLDSILVRVYPDSTPPDVSDPSSRKFVRRWVRITPFPSSAIFTAKLQWMYHDYVSTDTEVDSGVQDERLLRCYYYGGSSWNVLPSKVNAFANIVTIDSITETQCGPIKHFALLLPETYTQTWFRQSNTYWQRWYDVKFADSQNGFILGEHGTVLRTTDGGLSWTQLQIGMNVPFYQLAIPSMNNIFAVGDYGSLYHSVDSGKTWSRIELGTTSDLHGITFVTPQVGWVWGKGGCLKQTTDGGLNWVGSCPDTTAGISISGLVAFDPNALIIFYDNGKVLRTINGGITWQPIDLHIPNPIVNAKNLGYSSVWAIGDSGFVLYSSNAGSSWTIRSIPAFVTLRGISILDSTTLYVAGDQGKIFYSTDNGANWYQQYTADSHDLYALTFLNSSHGYAVGNGGTILATTSTGTVTDVGPIIAQVPNGFTLYQNYPNPFNPITTIVYELPKRSHVTIKIYNLLGQEVKTLVDDFTDPGRHAITWNVPQGGMASGIYFYRIAAERIGSGNSFYQTRKLVLLR